MDYKITWTEEADRNLSEILDRISRRWTEKEVVNFKKRLSDLLDTITKFPFIFPKSEYRADLRKAVHSKQTIVYYHIREFTIYIVYIFHTRKDPETIK